MEAGHSRNAFSRLARPSSEAAALKIADHADRTEELHDGEAPPAEEASRVTMAA